MAARKRKKRELKSEVKSDVATPHPIRTEELRALFDLSDTSQSGASSRGDTGMTGVSALMPSAVTKTVLDVTEVRPSPAPEDTPTVPTENRVIESGLSKTTAHGGLSRPIPVAPERRVSPRQSKHDEKPVSWWLGSMLLLGAVLLTFFGWVHIQRGAVKPRSVRTDLASGDHRDENQKRVEYYRKQLGQRLNMGRVAVEIDNQLLAPTLTGAEVRPVQMDPLRGVPLYPEGHGSKSARDKTEPVSIDHPDARIQYGLQEEQHHDEFQKRADRAYVREFIDNARREGYDVKVDSELNVISVVPLPSGARHPSADQGPPSTSR